MTIKKATREALGETLIELANEGRDDIVVLDADLAKATSTVKFKAAYPERFFDVGIAEQNLIGTAAGLAVGGKTPFASSFAVFATGRAYDQVRNSVCYGNLNVKIAATHAGVTVGPGKSILLDGLDLAGCKAQNVLDRGPARAAFCIQEIY